MSSTTTDHTTITTSPGATATTSPPVAKAAPPAAAGSQDDQALALAVGDRLETMVAGGQVTPPTLLLALDVLQLAVGEAPLLPASEQGLRTTSGRVLERLVPFAPEQVREELRLVLAARVTTPPPAVKRHRQLGLLMEMLAEEATGQLIATERYEERRKEAAKQGDVWPTATELIRDLGGKKGLRQGVPWARVCVKAMGLLVGTGARHWPADARHLSRRHPKFTPFVLVQAVWRFEQATGYQARKPEYLAWAHLQRNHIIRTKRGAEPYLPSISPLERILREEGWSWEKATALGHTWGTMHVLPKGVEAVLPPVPKAKKKR